MAQGVRAAGRVSSSPDFTNYQGVILAEFVAAELLTAATPIATRQNVAGLSPYQPADMIKLLSIGIVYFVLELMAVANARTGRLAAWFGGLVLLSVGLYEANNITGIFALLAGKLQGAASATGSAASSAGSTASSAASSAAQSASSKLENQIHNATHGRF